MCQLLASIFNEKRKSCTDSAQPLAGSVIPSGERVSCLFARIEALRITMLFAAARRLCALLRLLRLLDRRTGKAGVIGGSCASAAGGRRWRVVMQCASALLRPGYKGSQGRNCRRAGGSSSLRSRKMEDMCLVRGDALCR